MQDERAREEGAGREASLDWRQWVPPQVRREILRFIRRAFLAGFVIGSAASAVYFHYSESREKPFQGAIIFAALAFTMPAFAVSLKIMLSMFYMSWGAQNQFDRTAAKAENTLGSVDRLIADGGKTLTREIVKEAFQELGKADGPLRRIEEAVASLTGPIGQPRSRKPGLLESGLGKTPISEPLLDEADPKGTTRILAQKGANGDI